MSREPNMTCEAFEDLVEPLAAGDLAMAGEIRAHLDGCASCREALALAVAIERSLAAQPAPVVPDRFVPAVLARARRERWRMERYLDLAFNAVLALAVAVGVGGLYAVLTVTGVAAVSADLGRLFMGGLGDAARHALPQLRLYAAASVLVGSGLALWWWAEGGLRA